MTGARFKQRRLNEVPLLRRVKVVRPDGKEKEFKHNRLDKALAFAAGEEKQLEGADHPLMQAAAAERSKSG